MKWLICWWRGHVIKAEIYKAANGLEYVFWCERCNCDLPGPEK